MMSDSIKIIFKKCKISVCQKPADHYLGYCMDHAVEFNVAKQAESDPINPNHYKSKSGIESIDVIEAFELGFNLGNATKYILRAGKKDPAKTKEDLEKAIWYLNRQIITLDNSTALS